MAGKFYAVKKGRKPGIYMSWDACKAQVMGFPNARYKGFKTKAEAEAFLNPDANELMQIDEDTLVAYVDGSYDHSQKRFSYGMVLMHDGIERYFAYPYEDKELATMRNVAGEIKGSEAAMRFAKENGYKKLAIHYDYEGIQKWCTGEWAAKKEGTQAYQRIYEEMKQYVQIKFVKVKGHSNDKYNDYSVVQKLDTWANLFCGKDNAQCANYAHGGAGFLTNFSYDKQYDRVVNEVDKNKIRRIFVVGVFNDVNSGKSVTDIISAARDLFGKIVKENPDAQVNFVPEIMPRSPDNVQILDQWGSGAKALVTAITAFSSVNVPDDWEHWIEGDDTWQADNRHPNVKGHELAADSAEQWIQTTNLPLDPSKDETDQSIKVKTKGNAHNHWLPVIVVPAVIILLIIVFTVIFIKRRPAKRCRHRRM